MKTTKKDTPPSEGLDSALQRMTTLFLFLIPSDREKFNKSLLQTNAIKTPPKKKPIRDIKIVSLTNSN